MKKYGQCSNLSTYVQVIIVQKRINLPTANMGSRHSKRKYNKEGHKQKMCKIGLSLGRNQLKVEGNFQFGYHSEIDKKYHAVDGEPQEEDINKKYEVAQDEKSYLHSHSHSVQKCKCRECNTFAIVQIHVQMFQAMPFKR